MRLFFYHDTIKPSSRDKAVISEACRICSGPANKECTLSGYNHAAMRPASGYFLRPCRLSRHLAPIRIQTRFAFESYNNILFPKKNACLGSFVKRSSPKRDRFNCATHICRPFSSTTVRDNSPRRITRKSPATGRSAPPSGCPLWVVRPRLPLLTKMACHRKLRLTDPISTAY